MTAFYDEAYFERQRRVGRFGATANRIKFEPYISPQHHVADFGCGGGFLLSGFSCKQKTGVEINPAAAAEARRNGLTVFANVAEIDGERVDVFISDNALEHVVDPYAVVKEVHRALKPGGTAIFVVPCESNLMRFREDDPDQHIYSWSPGALGNLFKLAGFEVIESRPFIHRWPPKPELVEKLLGARGFHLAARLWGAMCLSIQQVRVVARKPGK